MSDRALTFIEFIREQTISWHKSDEVRKNMKLWLSAPAPAADLQFKYSPTKVLRSRCWKRGQCSTLPRSSRSTCGHTKWLTAVRRRVERPISVKASHSATLQPQAEAGSWMASLIRLLRGASFSGFGHASSEAGPT